MKIHRRGMLARPRAWGAYLIWIGWGSACAGSVVTPGPAAPTRPGESILTMLPLEGRSIVLGRNASGVLSQDDMRLEGSPVQAWALDIPAGRPVVVEAISSAFDPYLYVASATSELADDDGGDGLNARLCFEVLDNLDYRAVVRSVGEEGGPFELRVSAASSPGIDCAEGRVRDSLPDEGRLDTSSSVELESLDFGGRSLQENVVHAGSLTTTESRFERRPVQAWALNPRAGQQFTIDLVSEAFDTFLYVVGPDSRVREDDDGGAGTNSRITFEAPTEGRYLIVASAYARDAATVGAFTLRATRALDIEEIPIAGRLTAGVPVMGALTNESPQYLRRASQVWEYDGRAGEEITVVARTGVFTPVLSIPELDASNSDREGDVALAVELPEDGRYRIVLASARGAGCYTLTLATGSSEVPEPIDCIWQNIAATAGVKTLPIGSRQLGTLREGGPTTPDNRGGFVDVWEFDATAATNMVVDVTSDDFDTYLHVFGYGVAESNDDGLKIRNSRVQFDPQHTGKHLAIVSSFGRGAIGNYEIRAWPRVFTQAASGRSPTSIGSVPVEDTLSVDGDVVQGALRSTDLVSDSGAYVRGWAFEGRQGDFITLHLDSEEFDTYLYLVSPDDSIIANDDSKPDSLNSKISLELPTTGAYRVVASSYDPGVEGRFNLRVNRSVPLDELDPGPRRVILETQLFGSLEEDDQFYRGRHAQAWELNGRRGDSLFIDVVTDGGDDFVPWVYLVGENFEREGSSDGRWATLEFEVPSDGSFRVVVSDSGGGTGCFGLLVSGRDRDRRPTDCRTRDVFQLTPSQPLTTGSVMDEIVTNDTRYGERGAFVKVFELATSLGDYVTLDLTSPDFRTFLNVVGTDGLWMTASPPDSTNARLEFEASADAVYRVLVGPRDKSIDGEFNLRADVYPAVNPQGPDLLTPGRAVYPALSEGSLYLGALLGRQGDTVTVMVESEDFKPLLQVWDDGVPLSDSAGGDVASIDFVPSGDGVFRIVVRALEGTGGCFALRASTPTNMASETNCRFGAVERESARLDLSRPTTGSLESGDVAWSEARQADGWTVSALEGQSFTIDAMSDDFDTFLYVIGPGVNSTDDDGGEDTNSRISFTASAAGSYLVIVTSYESDSGGYTIRATPWVQDLSEIEPVSSVQPGFEMFGSLTSEDQEYLDRRAKAWTIRGREGDSIVIDLVSDAFSTYLHFVGADSTLESYGRSSRLATVFPHTGEYTIAMSSTDIGCFALKVSDAQRHDPPRGCTTRDFYELTAQDLDIEVPNTVGEWDRQLQWDLGENEPSVSGRPAQAWILRGTAGDSITIDHMADFDAYLTVLGPGIGRLNDDDGGQGYDSRLSFVISETNAEYRVIAAALSARASGCYTLRFRRSHVPFGSRVSPDACRSVRRFVQRRSNTPALQRESVVTGSLGPVQSGGDSSVARFRAWNLDLTDWQSERPMVVEVMSDEFDTRLVVLDAHMMPFGNVVVDDNGAGRCNDARVLIAVPGRYRVVVTETDTDWSTGQSFRLRATETPTMRSPNECAPFLSALPLADTTLTFSKDEVRDGFEEKKGELTSGSTAQVWSMRLVGRPAALDVISQDFDVHLTVLGKGNATESDDDSGLRCNARIVLTDTVMTRLGDTLRLVVSPVRPGDGGAYDLRVSFPNADNLPNRGSGSPCEDFDSDFGDLGDLPTDNTRILTRSLGPEGQRGRLTRADAVNADGSFVQAWRLDAIQGDSLTLDLIGEAEAFDAYLYLSGPGIRTLTNDDGAGGCHARIAFVAPKNATYRVVVSTIHEGQTGPFTLRLQNGLRQPETSSACPGR